MPSKSRRNGYFSRILPDSDHKPRIYRKNHSMSSVPFQQGDWICKSCDKHNFARSSVCFRCQKEKKKAGFSTIKVDVDPKYRKKWREGDWNCTECGAHNFAGRGIQCYRCQASKNHNGDVAFANPKEKTIPKKSLVAQKPLVTRERNVLDSNDGKKTISYRCNRCGKLFSSWEICQQHLIAEHGLKTYSKRHDEYTQEEAPAGDVVELCVQLNQSFNISEASILECEICLEGRIECILLPCKHVKTCFDCGVDLKESGMSCPFGCAGGIEEVVKFANNLI